MQQDPVAARNILALKKKEFEIKFDLRNSSYDAVENIGTGAYGVVCSAIHRVSKVKVAIKKIPDIFDQPTIAKRTFREIKILKHFKHDNIISIREILKPTEPQSKFKDVYIVLDLMESDMHRVIHSKQELTDEHVRYFLYQILRGLKYILSANIIHRDLKPSNLLVNENCTLKIGDFGMARAISSDPDEYNFQLTQYVATRWYRAPEIMMAQVAYSGAVDMWSVGCILAEMLGRRQLFPGRDYVHQIKLIIGILGSPTQDFIRHVKSDNIKNFIQSLGQKKPESLSKLYPNAKKKAVDLLSKMLVLDPNHRISVEKALTHPYLNNYHDPDDEPVCIPVFDFDFEKKTLSQPDLKDAIVKEIMDYHKPKEKPKLTFNFRPVPASELHKTPSPVVNKTKSGLNELIKHDAMDTKKVVVSQDSLDEQLEQFKRISKELEKSGNTLQTTSTSDKTVVDKVRTSNLQTTENDIEMLSAKLSATTVDEKDGNKVSIKSESGELDVQMLSAKKEEYVKGQIKDEQKPINAKEVLKNALLNARAAKQRGEEKPKPITAIQRQREREDRRKKKLEKARERKKKQKQKESPLKLTNDDLDLLARWKNMQPRKVQQTESAQPQTYPVQQTGATILGVPHIVTVPNSTVSSTIIPPNSQPTTTAVLNRIQSISTTTSAASISQTHLPTQSVNFENYHPVQDMNSVKTALIPTTNSNVHVHSVVPAAQTGVQCISQPYIPPVSTQPNNDHTPHQSIQAGEPTTKIPPQSSQTTDTTSPLTSFLEALQSSKSNPDMFGLLNSSTTASMETVHPVKADTIVPSSNSCANPTKCPPSYNEAILSKQDTFPGITVETHSQINTDSPSMNPSAQLPFSSFSPDKMLSSTQQPSPLLPPALSNLLQPSEGASGSATDWLEKARSSDDLTLGHTPRGTGAGYGVGLDLDAILAESSAVMGQKSADLRLDSAPLSASLIQDWLEVTGNITARDLENLEMEIGSPFPEIK